MKILFITNVPSPYRVAFFNELGRFCDLTVLFERSNSKERDHSWKDYCFKTFRGIILPGIPFMTDLSFSFHVLRYLKHEHFDRIVCADFTSPTGMLAMAYMRRHSIPYYLESDGGFPKNKKGFREYLKKWSIKDALGYFSTGIIHDEYYKHYGAPSDRIIRYPFSSIRDCQILETSVPEQEKLKLREKLGIAEKHVILTVGQFIHRKGFDVLLQCADSFDDSVGFYFVGGVPTEEYLRYKKDKKLDNVHFVGFQPPIELKKYYKSADIFVLPTREDIWGLVINEAMAYGLPIVTTSRCLAGIEMIKSGNNGWIVEAEDQTGLSNAINAILSHPSEADVMAKNNLYKAHRYTIEAMVDKHLEVFGLQGRMK